MSRVVLFSYAAFVPEQLALLRELESEPVALVVPSNRSADTTAAARTAGVAAEIPVLEQPPRDQAATWAEQLAALEPSVFLVWSYSMILPPDAIGVPPRGCVNVHGGLLPAYRGGHVLQWAIVNGEPETGVTLHYVDAGIDTGPIIGIRSFPIEAEDDAATVSKKLRETGFALLREYWVEIVAGTAVASPQPVEGTYWPLRSDADGAIDWCAPASAVRNLVRALVDPWPGAYTTLAGERLAIDVVDIALLRPEAEPGTVLSAAPSAVVVAAGDGAVVIRKPDLAARPGDRLGS
jgi:methionyl-tRNA formyltransferase